MPEEVDESDPEAVARFCILAFAAAMRPSLFFIAHSRAFRNAVTACSNDFVLPLKPNSSMRVIRYFMEPPVTDGLTRRCAYSLRIPIWKIFVIKEGLLSYTISGPLPKMIAVCESLAHRLHRHYEPVAHLQRALTLGLLARQKKLGIIGVVCSASGLIKESSSV